MTNDKLKWHFHFLDVFLLFIPISILFYFLKLPSLLSFLMTAAALIGMAHLMAESTSIIANRVSSTISALINATFGNAVELFIAIFSLRAGLIGLVTASITGSILINVLLLIGLAMFSGGLKFKLCRSFFYNAVYRSGRFGIALNVPNDTGHSFP